MNKEKLLYEAPAALTFVVKCQGALLVTSPTSNDNTEPFSNGWDDDL